MIVNYSELIQPTIAIIMTLGKKKHIDLTVLCHWNDGNCFGANYENYLILALFQVCELL